MNIVPRFVRKCNCFFVENLLKFQIHHAIIFVDKQNAVLCGHGVFHKLGEGILFVN